MIVRQLHLVNLPAKNTVEDIIKKVVFYNSSALIAKFVVSKHMHYSTQSILVEH